MKAQLILENGARFEGTAFGKKTSVAGEVVFTSGMTGYQEMLTDPSCAGQIVTMTFPLIGNYGINLEDMESERAYPKALVVRHKCDYPSNFRNEMTLSDFLKTQGVVGIEGIDTRALTRVLRNYGSMKGLIVMGEISDEDAMKKIAELKKENLVEKNSTKKAYVYNKKGTKNVALIDLGVKAGILSELSKRDCRVTVYPAATKAEEILKQKPDMLFLSNGAGDPKDAKVTIETVKELIGKLPIAAVCLGHLVLAEALGATTGKMKFGHHGTHPVKDLSSGRVYIATQNHNYVVEKLTSDLEATFVNVNDKTIEGFAHKSLPIKSVQFHPEASPGPSEARFIFDDFVNLM